MNDQIACIDGARRPVRWNAAAIRAALNSLGLVSAEGPAGTVELTQDDTEAHELYLSANDEQLRAFPFDAANKASVQNQAIAQFMRVTAIGESQLDPACESQARALVAAAMKSVREGLHLSEDGSDDMAQFNAADKAVHKVEDEWHYPIMTKYGYVPDTKTGVGFVRRYAYTNPATKHTMTVHTGVHCDYWTDPVNPSKTGKCYWGDLEPHLRSIVPAAPAA